MLCVWGYDGALLTYGVYDARTHRDFSKPMKRLEHEFVKLIEKESKKGLRAVAVALDAIEGFASARLIITAVNTACWSLDIPAVAIQSQLRTTPDQVYTSGVKAVGSSWKFRKSLAPVYRREAHITVSTRSKKFTIGQGRDTLQT